MRVALIGATGLVGGELARLLLREGHEVHALVRRPTGIAEPLWRERVAPAAAWPGLAAEAGAEAAVSALGTTIRQAGSRDAFRAVDLDIVRNFAAAARAAGARQMVAVSSVGADPRARNFYLRTKGEMEQALAGVGFEGLDFLRPGLLLGERGGPTRPAERLGVLLSPALNLMLRGRLDRYAAIPAATVAAAAAACLAQRQPGLFRHGNREMRALARLQKVGAIV